MPSGLTDAVGKLDGIDGIGIVRFEKGDVVRHPLVSKIINAYEAVTAPPAKGGKLPAA